MIEQTTIEHTIQKYIINVLTYQKYARFRDMRPNNVDTNLYSYHLKLLQKHHFVEKATDGYALAPKGLSYVDRINASSLQLSVQPKVITMLIIQNGYGGILMYKKLRQPFIDAWTLPFGKVHSADPSLVDAAKREIKEKIADIELDLEHVGDCYIRVVDDEDSIVSTIAHVYYATTDDELSQHNEYLKWVSPRALLELDAAPAIKDIIARTFFRDPYFFEEFTVAW